MISKLDELTFTSELSAPFIRPCATSKQKAYQITSSGKIDWALRHLAWQPVLEKENWIYTNFLYQFFKAQYSALKNWSCITSSLLALVRSQLLENWLSFLSIAIDLKEGKLNHNICTALKKIDLVSHPALSNSAFPAVAKQTELFNIWYDNQASRKKIIFAVL